MNQSGIVRKKGPAKITPLMKQYFEMKAKNKDALLLFRVGDFYETFGEDEAIMDSITIRFYYDDSKVDEDELYLLRYIGGIGEIIQLWESKDIIINKDANYVQFTTTDPFDEVVDFYSDALNTYDPEFLSHTTDLGRQTAISIPQKNGMISVAIQEFTAEGTVNITFMAVGS